MKINIKKHIVVILKGKFLKIKDMPYLIKYVDFNSSFNNGIMFMEMALRQNKTAEDKIMALNYIIDTIKRDIQTDLISDIIYKNGNKKENFVLFPLSYYDEKGNVHNLGIEANVIKDIDFEKDFVISTPWEKERIFDVIKKIKRYGFRYNENNHCSVYYTDVDICFVTSTGNHSVSVGINNRKGRIKSQVINISPLFEHVYSDDGLYWYDKHTKNKISSVQDFRLALIFEITKEKLSLKINKENKESKEFKTPDLDEECTYYGVMLEKFDEGIAKGEEIGKLKWETIGKIEGIIETGIKFNISKDMLLNEVVKEINAPKEKFDKLYYEIFDKINLNNRTRKS